MEIINITEFKAKALQKLDAISKTKQTLVITKRGRPLVKVVPFQNEPSLLKPGQMENTIISEGDLISPIVSKDWEANY